MRWSWKIGRILGMNVYMHATFLLLVAFVLYAYWRSEHSVMTALWGLAFILVIFACIVLHEFGHALTARRYGVRTRDIILLPIGGVARLERMPEKPSEELAVAVAGPAVNVVISVVLAGFLLASGVPLAWRDIWLMRGGFLEQLMSVNLLLVGFNLLPAFPMDGGRVLRALLATRMEYTRATQLAARVGQAMALVFGLVGLLSDPFLLFIALFVWMGADAEASMTLMKTSMGGIPVQQVMVTDYQTLRPDDTLENAMKHVLGGWQQDFPVVFGDHILGVLTREDVVKSLGQAEAGTLVRDAMRRDFQTADSHDMLDRALTLLHNGHCRSLPVEHDGHLVGLLSADTVAQFMMLQSALRRRKRLWNRRQPVELPPGSPQHHDPSP